jgi:hypothetical protein
MTIEIKDASGTRVMLLGDREPLHKQGYWSIYIEPTRNDACLSLGGIFPTAELLAALGVDPDWRERVDAAESCQLAADNMLRAESELAEAKASIDNWRQEAGIQSRRAEAAEAKLVEAEFAPAEVCVEGSWFKPADLPAVLGNHMRAATELARKVKAAEAKLARVDAEAVRMDAASRLRQAGLGKAEDVWAVCNARANVLTEAAGSIRAALADPEPFMLPTEAGARFEASFESTAVRAEFETIIAGRDILYLRRHGAGDAYTVYTPEQVMDHTRFTNHRLIEAAG